MAQGLPLDDNDRMPWLDAVAATADAAGETVLACSALRRHYIMPDIVEPPTAPP